MKILPIATLSGLALTATMACATPFPNAYIGVGAGLNSFNDAGLSYTKTEGGNVATTVYGGYIFNRIFGLEASYNHYGDIDAKGLSGNFMAPTSFSLSANLGYSFANGVRPFALVGVSSFDAGHNHYLKDDQGASIHWGVGVDYVMPNMPLTLRVAYQADSFGIEHKDASVEGGSAYDGTMTVGMAYVGASYHF